MIGKTVSMQLETNTHKVLELEKVVQMRWMIPKKPIALPRVLAISQRVKFRLWQPQAE
jgi:hypothetical protein